MLVVRGGTGSLRGVLVRARKARPKIEGNRERVCVLDTADGKFLVFHPATRRKARLQTPVGSERTDRREQRGHRADDRRKGGEQLPFDQRHGRGPL